MVGTPLPGMRIVAVVSGDVITSGDVENRARLFALSTGLPTTPEVIDRLKTQIANQLVDERLRLQEAQRRKVVVPDKQIAAAIHDIEQRNNMPEGAMRPRLAGTGRQRAHADRPDSRAAGLDAGAARATGRQDQHHRHRDR